MLGHCLFPALILDSATSLRTLDASIEETGRKQEQVSRGLQPAVRTGDNAIHRVQADAEGGRLRVC